MPEPVVTVERDGEDLLVGVDRAAKRSAYRCDHALLFRRFAGR